MNDTTSRVGANRGGQQTVRTAIPDIQNAGKNLKKEDKKAQTENVEKLNELNSQLQDLLFSTKELSNNMKKTNEYIQNDLALKIKSDLDFFDF